VRSDRAWSGRRHALFDNVRSRPRVIQESDSEPWPQGTVVPVGRWLAAPSGSAELAPPARPGRLDHLQLVAGFSEAVEPSLLRCCRCAAFRLSLLSLAEFGLQLARLPLALPGFGLLGQRFRHALRRPGAPRWGSRLRGRRRNGAGSEPVPAGCSPIAWDAFPGELAATGCRPGASVSCSARVWLISATWGFAPRESLHKSSNGAFNETRTRPEFRCAGPVERIRGHGSTVFAAWSRRRARPVKVLTFSGTVGRRQLEQLVQLLVSLVHLLARLRLDWIAFGPPPTA